MQNYQQQQQQQYFYLLLVLLLGCLVQTTNQVCTPEQKENPCFTIGQVYAYKTLSFSANPVNSTQMYVRNAFNNSILNMEKRFNLTEDTGRVYSTCKCRPQVYSNGTLYSYGQLKTLNVQEAYYPATADTQQYFNCYSYSGSCTRLPYNSFNIPFVRDKQFQSVEVGAGAVVQQVFDKAAQYKIDFAERFNVLTRREIGYACECDPLLPFLSYYDLTKPCILQLTAASVEDVCIPFDELDFALFSIISVPLANTEYQYTVISGQLQAVIQDVQKKFDIKIIK